MMLQAHNFKISKQTKQRISVLTCSIMLCSFMLTACESKQKTADTDSAPAASEVQNETLSLKGTSQRLTTNLVKCSGKDCPEFVVERLQTNFDFIDKKIDQVILNNLKQILAITATHSDQHAAASSVTAASTPSISQFEPQTAQQKMQQKIDPYVQSFNQLNQELNALGANHKINIMIKPSILISQAPVATVVVNTSSYLGGAHGSAAQQYYNFDLENEKQVQLDDLFLPKQKKAFEALAYKAFKAWVKDNNLADNFHDYEQAWRFKLSSSFLLSEQGLILQYGEYEIGPYAVGLPRLIISYDQLHTILKPEYLPKVTAASEVAVNRESS